jgi:hypothetical protein
VVAFEMNPTFVTHLQTEFPDRHSSWCTVRRRGAEVLSNWAPTRGPAGIRHSLERNVEIGAAALIADWHRLLRPGVLVVYRSHGLRSCAGCSANRQEFEPLNVLPARVFRCAV